MWIVASVIAWEVHTETCPDVVWPVSPSREPLALWMSKPCSVYPLASEQSVLLASTSTQGSSSASMPASSRRCCTFKPAHTVHRAKVETIAKLCHQRIFQRTKDD